MGVRPVIGAAVTALGEQEGGEEKVDSRLQAVDGEMIAKPALEETQGSCMRAASSPLASAWIHASSSSIDSGAGAFRTIGHGDREGLNVLRIAAALALRSSTGRLLGFFGEVDRAGR